MPTTMKINGKIESDGHLHLDVDTNLPAGDADVVLVIEPSGNGRQYDFSDLAGKMKWRGNAVAQQRELRNEW